MSTPITPDRTIGDLVTERPARARIFENFGIDFCCGGGKSLARACGEKNLDAQQIIGVLNLLDAAPAADETDWSKQPLSALADHIERTHHAYLRRQLPWLDQVTEKVARRHGDRDPRLVELRLVFTTFAAELGAHMQKEEQVLFPLVRRLEQGDGSAAAPCGGSIRNPIAQMVREHDDAGDALARMRELTDDYAVPEGACNTFRAMLEALRELELDMHRHVHKENSILFPRAAAAEAALQPA